VPFIKKDKKILDIAEYQVINKKMIKELLENDTGEES